MIRRKIEVHRLTISGLEDDADYVEFLVSLRSQLTSAEGATQRGQSKSHLLWDCRRMGSGRVQMQFLSFARGFRPDILDTKDFEISETPLAENQTGVEWTHCIGGRVGDRFILIIEKHQGGIYPRSIEHYLNWLVLHVGEVPMATLDNDEEFDVVVSLEAEPGEEFIRRLEALDRITAATYRVVRPNPGWADLESELGTQADDSNAQRAEISMRPVRRGTLSPVQGIIAAIKSRFRSQELDFAHVEGSRAGRKDAFNTERLGKHAYLELGTDERGQVDHKDAWQKLNDLFDGVA